MADAYKVIKDNTPVKAEKKASAKTTRTLSKGKEVKVYNITVGESNVRYAKISSSKKEFVNIDSLSKIGSDKESKSSSSSENVGVAKENEDVARASKISGNGNDAYNRLIRRYVRAFGSPSRFTTEVDPLYATTPGIGPGRIMSQTWMTDTSILSLCPGTVDYLPGFHRKQKDKFWANIKSSLNGDLLSMSKSDRQKDLNGQLYAFKSAYSDYISVVNLLARIVVDFMGIGDTKASDIFVGTPENIKLNKFDYGWYNAPEKVTNASNIFTETKNSLNTAVAEDSYVHFFVNHTGVSASETITTEAGKSWLEENIAGSGTGLDTMARNLQFLLGGAITPQASKDIEKVLKQARKESELLGGFATIAKNYLEGGRLVFPKMITGMNYEKSMTVEILFRSIYGDKRSIFKYCILPCLHLLALATPKQLSSNMYTYPYLCRAYNRGNINMDLAFMSNLEFLRGGSDGTSWTVDGLPTDVTARFTITPLYSNMMVTSAKNPFLALQNTALLEYLGTMVGLDLKANNLAVKSQIAKNLLANKISDIPTNLARGITDTKIMNEIRKFTSITN